MIFNCPIYLQHFLQRKIPVLVLLMIFSIAGYAQNTPVQKNSFLGHRLNSVFAAANKKPFQLTVSYVSPPYKVYMVRKSDGIMYWPNFPLTAAQITERDKIYDRPIGQQIVSGITESIINDIIYGKKKPVAVIPKF
jgi:hypothetical protein